MLKVIEDLVISDDITKLDIGLIHNFLTTSYWAKGRTIEEVKSSIRNSCASEFTKMLSRLVLHESYPIIPL